MAATDGSVRYGNCSRTGPDILRQAHAGLGRDICASLRYRAAARGTHRSPGCYYFRLFVLSGIRHSGQDPTSDQHWFHFLRRWSQVTSSAVLYGVSECLDRAISFFEQFGRTPSPGASIPDFLFYLVDDINSGFLDGTNIIKANNIQSRNICKHVDNYIKRISASAQDESKIFSGSSSFLQQFHDPRSAGFGKWHGSDSLYSGSPEAVSSGANNVIIKSLLDSLEWIRGCGCLTMEEEDACVQPRISKQFTWCLWRACSIRARNVNHLTGKLLRYSC